MFGKITPDTESLYKYLYEKFQREFFVEDNGIVRIVAGNNRNLFNMLKVRVSTLVTKAMTLPQFIPMATG
jgi:hypothetical protein